MNGRRFPTGGEDEIIRLYGQTIRPLYAYVSRRVGGDSELAEDLVQDTWMRALDAWPSRGLPDEPLAWLIRVARNTLVSHFRRVRPEAMDMSTLDHLAVPAAAADSPDLAGLVSWALARMRRRHVDLLEAMYFDGKTVREIAAERATSERAIEGRLRRARAVLKKVLERAMRTPPSGSAVTLAESGTKHDRQA